MSALAAPLTPASGQAVAAPASPAKPLTAIEKIEQELSNWVKQREQAVANVHALEGAIQGGQHLLAVLKAEEAKAIAAAKKVETSVVDEVKKVEGDLEKV